MQPFLPMLTFALVMGITPGPNNTLLMITCANWGFRRSIPVVLGVVGGFLLMVFAVGIGLGGVFAAWPALHTILKWACFAWLLVLAWKIARAGRPEMGGKEAARPLPFFVVMAFQWVNPKAWMMAVGAMALYVPVGVEPLWPVLRVVLAFGLAAVPCALCWCLFGAAVARFLTSPRRVTVFNVTMAVLLVLSMIPTLL
jgi:threonine/homoserine/homoserine lactone efflux protein